ncbi:hypothetical protein KEF29_35235 [Streptomyces tuirus]|uniref:Uncharacterized protein n=1 Tax=Streptomyces tuirus TaxID=68278 RepID=A0A941FGG0_9ACTN|nr:hypothetical protein [Streptomyces tuirus]
MGGARGGHPPRAARCCLRGGIALAAAALQFALAPAFGPVAAAVVLTTAMISLTLGEIWQSAGGWEISYALSPEDRRNTYLGVFSLGPTGAQIIGPVVVVMGVVGGGPPGWVILAATFATTGFAVMRATLTSRTPDDRPHVTRAE